jgi:hypothetical protein
MLHQEPNRRKRSYTMCDEKQSEGCRKPDNLKGKPQDCSPEQIRRCHGDAPNHPCCDPPADKAE